MNPSLAILYTTAKLCGHVIIYFPFRFHINGLWGGDRCRQCRARREGILKALYFKGALNSDGKWQMLWPFSGPHAFGLAWLCFAAPPPSKPWPIGAILGHPQVCCSNVCYVMKQPRNLTKRLENGQREREKRKREG